MRRCRTAEALASRPRCASGRGEGAATTEEAKHGPRVAGVACPGDRRYEGNRTGDRGHASRRGCCCRVRPRASLSAPPGGRPPGRNRKTRRLRRQRAPSGVMEFLARIEQLNTTRSRPADPGDGVPRTYPLRQLGLRADARRAAGEHPVLTGRESDGSAGGSQWDRIWAAK